MKKLKPGGKIAIVGTAPSSCELAPYEDKSWQIWSLGRNYQLTKRFDLWFELHYLWLLKELCIAPEQLQHMKDCGSKLVMQAYEAEFPDATVYPKEEILRKYPRRYFTSSIAWMMAYAMEQNPTHIGLWGIDLCVNEEYNYQKGCAEYLIGMAEGKGIEVVIPKVSTLCRASYLYGFEEPAWLSDINLRKKESEQVLKNTESKSMQYQLEVAYQKGVRDCLADQEKRWM